MSPELEQHVKELEEVLGLVLVEFLRRGGDE